MDMNEKDLLLHDLEYARSSFWKSEEIGEKRFNFFVTLVTAVAGALIALSKVDSGTVSDVVPWALWFLLAFGLLTYARMLHRNAVSDNFKEVADYIWATSLAFCGVLQAKKYKLEWKPKRGSSKWVRAGYADVIGAFNGALLSGLLIFQFKSDTTLAVASGVVLATLSWIPSVMRK